MDNTRETVYLASLLHDIGKFYQRAGDKSFNLTSEYEKLESVYCPYNNYYSHKHVLWTAQFIDTNKNIFKNFKNLERLASAHHKPYKTNPLELLIQKADHLASGVDRTDSKYDKEETQENFKEVKMLSVFENLFLENFEQKENNDEWSFKKEYNLPFKEICLDESFFPYSSKEQKSNNYFNLLKSFEEEFKSTFKTDSTLNDKTICETIYSLLYKYTATIPSSTIHLPDVSLFDHVKTTAAFAICLYDYLNEKNEIKSFEIDDSESAFLLIGGDISGIQSYIYSIISKHANKNLKGRSFYLQLLVDTVLETIIKNLKLFKANIIYASGGGFYILAPNTKQINNSLNEINEQISKNIFDCHKTSLFLAVDSVPISLQDIYGKIENGKRTKNIISEKWKELTEKLNTKKRSRFKKHIEQNYEYFFEARNITGKESKDVITNEIIHINDKTEKIEEGTILTSTKQQIELGKKLNSTNYIVKTTNNNYKNLADFYYFNPLKLSNYYYLISNENELQKISLTDTEIIKLNDVNFLLSKHLNSNNILSFDFYGGNKYPTNDDNSPKTFDELTLNNSNENTTFKRLGVLRMDVDNLGQAFINGFCNNRRTFSRYSTLSRSLDYFFKGYINKIWEENSYNNLKYKDHSYIVYAGGDDLFIVGKWDVVINFAETIYKSFKNWTCHNPYLGLSAGIAIVPGKFPIIKAAEISGKFESLAKSHNITINNKLIEKNSITIFGLPLNWDYEYEHVKKLKNDIYNFIKNNKLSNSFIEKINNLEMMRKKQENFAWIWTMSYHFKRIKNTYNNQELNTWLEEHRDQCITNTFKNNTNIKSNYHQLELLNLACRWAELELR